MRGAFPARERQRLGKKIATAESSDREPSMKREDLTEKILDVKREKGWSWKQYLRRDRRRLADH